MKIAQPVMLTILCLALSACGGGGGGSIASTPAPVPLPTPAPSPTPVTSLGLQEASRTALPATPATITGDYKPIASYYAFEADLQSGDMKVAPAGALGLKIDAATRSYTLTLTGAPIQFETGNLTLPATSPLGYRITYVEKFSDGSTKPGPTIDRNNPDLTGSPVDWRDKGYMMTSNVPAGNGATGAPRVQSSWIRLYNVGQVAGAPKYLSTGYWGQFYSENSTGIPDPANFKPTRGVVGMMVFGQRTEPGDMPGSGKARYEVVSLFNPPGSDENGKPIYPNGKTSLDVDFATRELTGRHDLERTDEVYESDEDGSTILGDDGYPILYKRSELAIGLSGFTKVANDGSFAMTLTGNGSLRVEYASDESIIEVAKPLTGSIDGAFFGPQAAEVGGIWSLPSELYEGGQVSVSVEAFGGIKSGP